MGIKTEYVCDNCGHTQNTSEQMWEVGIACRHLDGVGAPGWERHAVKQKNALWCRECVLKAGILVQPRPIKYTESEPTLEDLIREIVRQEMEP